MNDFFIIFALRELKRKQALQRCNLSAIDFLRYTVTKWGDGVCYPLFIGYRYRPMAEKNLIVYVMKNYKNNLLSVVQRLQFLVSIFIDKRRILHEAVRAARFFYRSLVIWVVLQFSSHFTGFIQLLVFEHRINPAQQFAGDTYDCLIWFHPPAIL